MYVFAAMICGYYHKPSHCLSIPQNACQIFLSKKTPEYSIFPTPSLKIRVSTLPHLGVYYCLCSRNQIYWTLKNKQGGVV